MELSNTLDLNKKEQNNKEIDDFIKELSKEIDKVTLKDIKIDEKSKLSLVNNIAKNNKMTDENRIKLFNEERQSIYEFYDKNKKAGELYYIVGENKDSVNVFTVNNDIWNEHFKIMKKSDLPENVEVGQIYRKNKNGEILLSKDETKQHEKKMKSVAKDILNKQNEEGGYKKGFTNKDLEIGKGYEGEYFKHPLGIDQELGKEAGLPLTMIENYLTNDINEAFEKVAKEISQDNTLYIVFPKERFKLYEVSNGQIKEAKISDRTYWTYDQFGLILKKNKSTESKKDKSELLQPEMLVENKKETKLFKENLLQELKSTVKNKYDEICKDYKKEGHIYEVEKAWDENYIPTITINDISENRFFELEDLDFINNKYAGDGKYVVKDGEYCKINAKKIIPKNHTVDRDKEDERNISNILANKYNLSKKDVEENVKEFMVEKSKENGAVVYTGYDKEKDEYYLDYYIEGKFDEREKISKDEANDMEVGTFSKMGTNELGQYSGFFEANKLAEELEDKLKKELLNE